MNNNQSSRRAFLKNLATFYGTGVLCFPKTMRAQPRPKPSERITVGFIGLGGHGIGVNLRNFINNAEVQVVALCDVDATHLSDAEKFVREHYAQQNKSGVSSGLDLFRDFRELVMRPDIDAVVVSTPDHWHVLVSLYAIREGKDVYCEKPLSRTVQEGRVLSDAVARYGRIFQTGSEFRGAYNFHRAAELVANGYIGALKEIQVYLPKNPLVPGNPRPMPVPKELDYDLWLGPAPYAPYTVDRVHFNYRWILDYSVGMLADWGAHLLDQAQWVMGRDLTGPVSVQATGRFINEGLYDTAVDFNIEYGYDNGVRVFCTDKNQELRGGIRYIGSDGQILAKYSGYQGRDITVEPRALSQVVIKPEEIHLYTCPQGPERNFLDCVKSRRQPYYPAEIGHRTATVCHIAHIAMLLGEPLHWDPMKERFQDHEIANRYLARDMRSPWHL